MTAAWVLAIIISAPILAFFAWWGHKRGTHADLPEWWIAGLVIAGLAYEDPITKAVSVVWVFGYLWGHRSRSASARTARRDRRALARSIERGDLEFHFQPIIDTGLSGSPVQGDVVAAEALVRRRHKGKLEGPGPWLDTIQADPHLTDLFHKKLIPYMAEFAAQWPHVRMSINTMPERLAQPGLAEQVLKLLREVDVSPYQVTCEVVETALLQNIPEVQENLRTLHKSGMHIALDDFGTGQANVATLMDFMEHVDTVKIDRQLVQHADRRGAGILIRLAQAFGKTVVAEGVETEDQAAWLRSVDVTQHQGWLYAKALSPPDFGSFMMRHGWGNWRAGFTLTNPLGVMETR